jgi:hypothetical protein
MPGFKEFLESLQMMKNVKLNLAVLVTCLVLILLSQPDKFILDPVPKLIPQSLILITSIRLVFSSINFLHSISSNKIKKRTDEIKQLKTQEQLRESISSEIENLDIFQVYIIKQLIGNNNFSHPKGAAIFSLNNHSIVYVVATGEKSQSVAFTKIAKDILSSVYKNDISSLEKKSSLRAFSAMTNKEISFFEQFLEKDTIDTTWTSRDGRTNYEPCYDLFKSLQKTIIFEHPQKGSEYSLNPVIFETLVESLTKRKE